MLKINPVLHIADYYCPTDDTGNSKFNTGYGHMVLNIATSIANICNEDIEKCVVLGLRNSNPKKRSVKSVEFYKCSVLKTKFLWELLLSKSFSFRETLRNANTKELVLLFKSLLYVTSSIETVGSNGLVHIHGITPTTFPYILYCIKKKISFCLTLHGLNSFSVDTNASPFYRSLERSVLQMWQQSPFIITCVSEGVRKNILANYGDRSDLRKFLITVANGVGQSTSISRTPTVKSDSASAFVCIGNISPRKNQLHIVKAMKVLKDRGISNLRLILIGNDSNAGDIKDFIEKHSLEKSVTITGLLTKEQVSNYLSASDFTICCSLSEGFGLPIVEGYLHGKPALVYSDLDAADMLASDDSTLVVDRGSVSELADSIITMSSRSWSSANIEKHGLKFSVEEMARQYLSVYRRII